MTFPCIMKEALGAFRKHIPWRNFRKVKEAVRWVFLYNQKYNLTESKTFDKNQYYDTDDIVSLPGIPEWYAKRHSNDRWMIYQKGVAIGDRIIGLIKDDGLLIYYSGANPEPIYVAGRLDLAKTQHPCHLHYIAHHLVL